MGCFVFLISYICLYIGHSYMFKIIKHILILDQIKIFCIKLKKKKAHQVIVKSGIIVINHIFGKLSSISQTKKSCN